MRKAVLAIAFWVVLGVTSKAEPFDLRGIGLGITLSEFRKLPFPDDGDAKVICRGDPEEKKISFLSSRELWTFEEGDGASGCGFFKFGEVLGKMEWYLAGLKVATIGSSATYVFVPDKNNTPRLYRIKVRSLVENWGTFWEGYTGRYGQPSKLSRDNAVAVWDRPDSIIILQKRSEKFDWMRITYIHKGLESLTKNRSLAKKGLPKDNL